MWPIIETFTLTFWGIVAVFIIVEVCFSLEYDRGWRWTALAIFVVFLLVLTDFNPVPWVLEDPLRAAAYVVGYIFCGVVWAFAKWYMFLREKRAEYALVRDELRAEFARIRSGGETYPKWVERRHNYPPRAMGNRERLQFWMAWWPFSFIATFTGELLLRFFQNLYRALSGSFDSMSDRVFGGFKDDFK